MKIKNPYLLYNVFCLRTPLLPFNFYEILTNDNEISNMQFRTLFKNQVFIEALFLASPELYKEYKRWFEGRLKNHQKAYRLKNSVLKYATRISTRCTPFGLFAGCASGTFDKRTNVSVRTKNHYKKITRLDMSFLSGLMETVSNDSSIKKSALFFTNSSLYKTGNHYRYVVYDYDKNKRVYSLDGFNGSPYLDNIVETAKKGKTLRELVSTIINNDINFGEAEAFINELIENQILVSEFQLLLSGKDNLTALIERIKQIDQQHFLLKQLNYLQKGLLKLDESANTIFSYETLIKQLEKIHPIPNKKYLFQVDTFINTNSNTFEYSLKKKLLQTLTFLNRITLPTVNTKIENFKKQFKNRYQTKELRLVDVLDTEIGIGYGSKKEDSNPILENVHFPEHSKNYDRIIWTVIDTILLEKLEVSIANKKQVIELTDEDFWDVNDKWDDLPDTMGSIVEIISEGNTEKLVMNSVGGTNGGKLLGRFAHGDNSINNHVKEIAQIEKQLNPNKILAEIIHLPQTRTGNVIKRSTSRDFEIPYLGKSSLSLKNQISIEDLMISIKNDTIILRSKKLKKEIIPTLTNAHNYRKDSLPIYHFLCDLQTENKRTTLGFSWNSIFNSFSFLPRVEYKNVIISKAQWHIKVNTLKHFFTFDDTLLLEDVKLWQEKLQMPKYVQLVDGDNTLVINMKNITSFKMFWNTVKNRNVCVLEEFLFSEASIVNQGVHHFCNQFVVTFYNDQKLKALNNAS